MKYFISHKNGTATKLNLIFFSVGFHFCGLIFLSFLIVTTYIKNQSKWFQLFNFMLDKMEIFCYNNVF